MSVKIANIILMTFAAALVVISVVLLILLIVKRVIMGYGVIYPIMAMFAVIFSCCLFLYIRNVQKQTK